VVEKGLEVLNLSSLNNERTLYTVLISLILYGVT